MTANEQYLLDADELLHLALREAGQNSTDKAIEYLKQLVKTAPNHGRGWYLLGALHAEISLYDRAVEEIHKAVELEPEMAAASYQLGLLYITSGRVDEAEKAWQALDQLGEESSLFLFKRGLLALANNEYQLCIDDLLRGITINEDNPDINTDMQRILGNAQKLLEELTCANAREAQATELSAYQRSNFDSEQ
ncbi:MAG: tetratricopeptide repeat protein [Gammaproteobacteria bacterium]|nr:tetratricopeptide repeat protein [Gammaproteobacteria bacterium]